MIAVDCIKLSPQVVEVHQVTQELHKLPLLNEPVSTNICSFVCSHESRFVVEIWVLQRTAQRSADHRFVDLGKRQAIVAVHIELAKQFDARLFVRHDELRWPLFLRRNW